MQTLTAEQFYASKTTVPSAMTTAEWSRVRLEVRERAFFMAAVERAEILEVFRVATGKVLSGELSEAQARREIREGLAANGYVPNAGEEGTIKDLSTLKRQDVVIRTNISMARNHAAYAKQWTARRAFPAKRMVRMQARRVPRHWQARWADAGRGLPGVNVDQMTALLDSPIWRRLNRFGADYAPYDFNSGMGDLAVRRDEAEAALGASAVAAWLGEIPTAPAPSPASTTPQPDAVPAAPGKPAEPALPEQLPTVPSPATVQPGGVPPSPSPPEPSGLPTPPFHDKPAPGLNESLEVTPALSTTEGRAALAEATRGLTEWQGDVLVYTDPNGTRPYPAERIPEIISTPNAAGVPLNQAEAVREWATGGAPALPPGTDRLAYFRSLVWRTLPMTGDLPLSLTRVFPSAAARAAAVARLPQGGTWTPVTEFPFLAVSKNEAAPGSAGFALTVKISKHHSARDLTPAVEALADADAHGHHVLFPRGAVFRVEEIHTTPDDGPVTILISEEGGAT